MKNYKIVGIWEINGKRQEISEEYRKTEFDNVEDLMRYKKYLEKRLEKDLYLGVKDKVSKKPGSLTR